MAGVVKIIEAQEGIKKVAAYARVSTLQEEQEDSYEGQVEYYEALIKSNPKWEFVKIYADKGISGVLADKRPGFQQMIKDARSGLIDIILVKSISRFARNTKEAVQYVHELKAINVEVYFEQQDISSYDASSDMIFNISAAIAQEESKSISENTKWALRRKAEQGIRKIGNRMFGYNEVDGVLVPDENAEYVRLIFNLYASGWSLSGIVDRLREAGVKTQTGADIFSIATIQGMLKNEIYVGDRLIQKQAPRNYLTKKPDYSKPYFSCKVTDSHEGIVDREIWEKVQERLNNRPTRQPRNDKTKHFLAGRIICHECGSNCYRLYDHGRYYWKCEGNRKGTCPVKHYHSETQILGMIRQKVGDEADEKEMNRWVRQVLLDADKEILVETY